MNFSTPAIQPKNWGSFFTAILFATGALAMFVLGFFLALISVLTQPNIKTSEPVSVLMLAFGKVAIGLLLIPGFYFNVINFLGRPDANNLAIKVDDRIFFSSLITLWLLSLMIGQAISTSQPVASLFLPFLNFLAVCLPIVMYLRIGLRGITLPSFRHVWTVFGASLVVSPILALILEACVFGAFLAIYILIVKFIPELNNQFSLMISTYESSKQSEDAIMQLVANLLFSPGTAIAALGIFSVAIPFIEETFKIILLWLLKNQIHRPSDGFVLGTLCGAAFALVENISFTSLGYADWSSSAAVRASAALPHIFNSGLLGWALISAKENHRYRQLAITFLAVTLVHGAWNAISLGLAMNSLAAYVPIIPFYLRNSYPWIAGWILLALAIFSGLIYNNSQMKKLQLAE